MSPLIPHTVSAPCPLSSSVLWEAALLRGRSLVDLGLDSSEAPRDISCLKGTLKEGKNRHSVLPQTPLGFSPALYKGPQTWQLFAISWKLLNIQMPGPRARPPTSESLRGATGASAFFFFFLMLSKRLQCAAKFEKGCLALISTPLQRRGRSGDRNTFLLLGHAVLGFGHAFPRTFVCERPGAPLCP